ncbi:MAG TPA: bacterial transcriptional activator domain-containing protein [Ktedonosporobacter sp.]|jgi:tetratricopeptide (TPR) repeat protein|nr:bacterial transcriptional activator domain-containing protein [Ktedonosporobacter sp.]
MKDEMTSLPLARVWLFGPFLAEYRDQDGTWKAIDKAVWEKGYSRSLLRRLLCAHGRRAARRLLLDDLWPDHAAPELAESYLNDAVSGLRKALPIPHILPKGGKGTSYALPDQSILWTDRDAFQELLKEAEWTGRTSARAVPLLEQACTYLQRGEFLEGQLGIWCYSRRATMERMQYNCYLWLAQAYEQQGLIGQAEMQYSRLLEDNPTDEEVLFLLIRLLHRQRKTHLAHKCYWEAQVAFEQAQIPFSPATETLIQQVLRELPSVTSSQAEPLPLYVPPEQPKHDTILPIFSSRISPVSLDGWSLALTHNTIRKDVNSDLEGQDVDKLRRDLMKLAIQVPLLSFPVGRDFLSLSVEEYLAHCELLVQDCWKLMGGKLLTVAEHILSAQMHPLMQIMYSPSPLRREAATIATQAKIVQAILAMHRLDLAARELFCTEAITCARLSENPRLSSIALMYLGSTYVYHSLPRQPERAVLLFQEALQCLDGEEPLLRGMIHSSLAAAQAQCQREQKALESLEKAQLWFPSSPELDPSFGIGCGKDAFSFQIGQALLDLARHAPERGYYAQAQHAFEQGIALPTIADRNTSQMLIGRAAAALGLGDLELYEASLRGGLVLAKEIGSQKRFIEAQTLFQEAPHPWRIDRRLQALKEEFFVPMQ